MMEQIRMDLGTIGQRLEAARQEKGASVSEAGQATKILPKYIEAMEADNFNVISAPIYVKGFIKIYSQYLGIDPEPMVQEYSGQIGTVKKTPLPDEVRQNLAKADIPTDTPSGKREVFGGVHKGVAGLKSPIALIAVIGSVLLITILGLTLSQCTRPEPATSTLSGTDVPVLSRDLLYDRQPDVYIEAPEKIDVAK